MAKVAKEKSAAAKALMSAQEQLKKAKEQLARQDNAANKKAVKEAQDTVSKHAETVRRERFEDVAGGRMATALKALTNLQNCASTRSYKFAEQDVQAMETALTNSLKATMAAFKASLAAPEAKGKTNTANKFTF